MISIYKKYNIAYDCICAVIILCMVSSLLVFHIPLKYYPLVTLVAVILVICNAYYFTQLANKKLLKEVFELFNECHINDYINKLNVLFEKRKAVVDPLYNALIAKGYACLDDYDTVFECCKKIKARNYQADYHLLLFDYYMKKENLESAQKEIEEYRIITNKIKNKTLKEACELNLKGAEYVVRIKNGDYEGAEEFYTNVLNTITPMYPITQVSYSYALGRLLVLKNEPERAKEYLQTACEYGGDTKYKYLAEEMLKNIIN